MDSVLPVIALMFRQGGGTYIAGGTGFGAASREHDLITPTFKRLTVFNPVLPLLRISPRDTGTCMK